MASFIVLRPLSTAHLLYPPNSSAASSSSASSSCFCSHHSHIHRHRHRHRCSSPSSASGKIWCQAHRRRSATHLSPSPLHSPPCPDSSTPSSFEWTLGSSRLKPWMHDRLCSAMALSSSGGNTQQQKGSVPPTGAATIPVGSSSSSFSSNATTTADPAAASKAPPKPFSFFEPKKPIPPIPLENFHYVMFATETMDDFEPPSPPSIPFGGPFEDYYGEIIGEDYIPKQEKPTSSFLMFLDSLNEKRTDLKKEEVPMPEGGFPGSSQDGVDGDDKKKKNPLDSYTPLFQHRHTPQSPKPDAVPYTPQSPKRDSASFTPQSPKRDPAPYTPLFRNDVLPPSPTPPPPPPSAIKTSSTQSNSPPPSPSSSSPSPSQQKPYTPLFPQNPPPPPPPPPPPSSQQKPFTPPTTFSPNNPPPSPMSPPQQKPYPPPPSPMSPPQQKPYGFPQSGPPPFPQQRPYTTPFPQNGPPPPPPPPLPPQQTPYTPMFPQSGHPPPRPPPPQQSYPPRFTQGSVTPPPPAPVRQSTPFSQSNSSAPVSQSPQFQQKESSPGPLQTDASNRNPSSADYVQGQSLGLRDASGMPMMPEIRGAGANRAPLFPQTRPAESTADSGNSYSEATSTGQPLPSAGVSYPTPSIPLNVKASEYYEPEDGDIVLGVVISSNDDELEIEIGAQLPAILPLRDFNPHPQMIENIFFNLPNTDEKGNDEFVAPFGKSLIVEDKSVIDGSYQGGEAGTVVLAEVRGRTLTDGRATLSCRSLAQRISWNRIGQLMQTGETVELEIMQYNEGGLLGFLEGTRAFLPKSELLQRPESSVSLKDYVGKVLRVAVTQADMEASNCIMSEVKAWMSKTLLLGSVHNVTVTKLYPYGMQVEIENTRIRGFVHISNISKEYVSSVATFFTEGEQARVMLIKGRNPGQVSFSTAELERERGLMLRNKAQVYEEAEEAARSYYEGLTQKEREIFSLEGHNADLRFQDLTAANLKWLHIRNGKISN